MRFSVRFYRAAATCSLLSAVTTLGLIFLPRFYPPVPDFAARMALGGERAYVLRSWIYLLHPFLVFAATVGLAARCRLRSAGSAAMGLAGFALWAATEAGQQALTKVALDRTWRVAWPRADATAQALIRERVALYDVLWDAMYVLLLFGFLLGNVFLAYAVGRVTNRGEESAKLGRWVSAALWAAAGLTLVNLLQDFGAVRAGSVLAWLYPAIQPAGRVLIGVWLWREAHCEQRIA